MATLCLFTTSGPDPGELPGFWGSMVFRHALIRRKGSGKQQQPRRLFTLQCKTKLRVHFEILELASSGICLQSVGIEKRYDRFPPCPPISL